MNRLTNRYMDTYAIKDLCEINQNGEIEYFLCDYMTAEYCKKFNDGVDEEGCCKDCILHSCIEKLGKYEDLVERLQDVYGECDGLLEMVVDHLGKHSGVDVSKPVFKAILLTDDDVDKWKKYKELKE